MISFSIITIVSVLLEFFVYRRFNAFVSSIRSRYFRMAIRGIYFLQIVIMYLMLGFIIMYFTLKVRLVDVSREFISGTLVVVFVPKVLFIFFVLFGEVVFMGEKLIHFIRASASKTPYHSPPRRDFILKMGGILSLSLLGGLLYGIVKGKYNFEVKKVKMAYKNFPKPLSGFKMVQLTDFHIGSFGKNNPNIQIIIDKINRLKADMFVFTGDMVNERAVEMEGYVEILKQINCPKKFAILGNHDYGTYYRWDNDQQRLDNLENLKRNMKDAELDLLLNEHRKIAENFYLIGVENWGRNFMKYGDIDTSIAGINTENNFCLLLSHDPTHWEKVIRDTYHIDLTLSGHTHGMQIGVKSEEMQWSPVQYFYKYWLGLYKSGEKFLYVNPGIGFIGYPGRLGMWPEITLFELSNTEG